MTAHEPTNAHGDAHAASLLRSRKRAWIAAWNRSVMHWRYWRANPGHFAERDYFHSLVDLPAHWVDPHDTAEGL